jgi:hypothetical protein
VQKILNSLSGSYSQARLYSLGGKNSNRVHAEYITPALTSPEADRRASNPEEYFRTAMKALKADFGSGDTSDPAFFALWIQSGFTGAEKDPTTPISIL